MALEVEQSTSIGDISLKSWRAIASATPLADYDWLKTLEATQDLNRKVVYWWIEDEHGILAAVVALLRATSTPGKAFDDEQYGYLAHVVRPLRRLLQPRPRLTLECGAQTAPGNPVLLRQGLSTEVCHSAVNSIVDSIESYCRNNRRALVFCAVFETDETLHSLFADRSYLNAAEMPNTALEIRWDSWSEYLKHLKKTHPSTEKSIRMQVNRGQRGGVIIEEVNDPSEIEDEIYRILAEHFHRKSQTPFFMRTAFASVIKKNLGDRALIYVAKKNGRIIGISIYIRNRTVMHWKFFGIATDSVRSRDAVYFNLAFHHMIKHACMDGCQKVLLGTGTYQVKCSRGAEMLPVSNWIWQHNRLLSFLQRALLWYLAWRQKRYLNQFVDQSQINSKEAN